MDPVKPTGTVDFMIMAVVSLRAIASSMTVSTELVSK
jgi:hypothetical protein